MKESEASFLKKIKARINKHATAYALLHIAVIVPFFFLSFNYPGYGGPIFLAVLLFASAFVGSRLGDLERSLKLLLVSCVFAATLIFIIAYSALPAFITLLQKAPGWYRILDPDYLLYFTPSHYGFVILGVVMIFTFMTFIVGFIGNVIGYAVSGIVGKRQ